MSGKPTIWMNREDVKGPNDPKLLYESQGVRGILKIPIKQFVVSAENINRFTQTEQAPTYRSSCVESDDKVMYEQTMQQQQQQAQQQQQQQQQQAQQHHVTELYALPKKEESPKTVEFPFCYNVNMLQKVQQHTAVNTIVGTPIANPNEEKGAYRFDVSQPFSYNYALVNQMSLAAAASTATFKCDICGLVFAHLSLLNHHKRIHTTNQTQTERVFPCDICGSSFAQAVDLKNHKQTAHNTVVKTGKCCSCGVEVDCEHLNKKKSKFLKCVNCEEEQNDREEQFEGTQEVGTETDDALKTVQPGAHPVKRRGMATVTKCHKCNGSGILFVGGVQPTVEKPFHCNICEGTFSRYSSLWSHKRLHTGDKPFKCEFCGLAFARAAYLKNHSRIHSGERPFKCDVCGMQFSQAPHLKNHERIHSGERPYECEICNKTFARHSTLWNHRRIHTGEKPYRCSVCGSAFNQATHLKNHQKVHTGEKPHRCDICEVGFSDRFALKRHRGIHEKYGQTASQQQAVPPQPAQQVSQEQQTVGRLEELYKCDVTAGIAFPGCSRPQEAK